MIRFSSRSLFSLLAVAVAALLLSGCRSSRSSVSRSARPQSSAVSAAADSGSRRVKVGVAPSGEVADALVAEARSWLGVPYVYGGASRSGADCSGFLCSLYRDVTGIALPRTTGKQRELCIPVDRRDLCVGDILFFSSNASSGKIAHVGMYVGNNRMIHSSSSRGVVEDDLSLNYYVKHYQGAGRVPAIAEAYPLPHRVVPADPVAPVVPEPLPVAALSPAQLSVAAAADSLAVPTDSVSDVAARVRNAFASRRAVP